MVLKILSATLFSVCVHGFNAPPVHSNVQAARSQVRMVQEERLPQRREFVKLSSGAAVAASVAQLFGLPLPAAAKDGPNDLLGLYGFPKMKVPKGFSPLVNFIGTAPPANVDGLKTKALPLTKTLLIRFAHPSLWVVSLPAINVNGEAGTISASDYAKGDSATLGALPLPEGKTMEDITKPFLKQFISQGMTGDVYTDIKVKGLKVVEQDAEKFVQFEYSYTLNTRAGFDVDRRGLGSLQAVGGDVAAGLLATTTAIRWSKMSDSLQGIVDSFHAYPVTKLPDSFEVEVSRKSGGYDVL